MRMSNRLRQVNGLTQKMHKLQDRELENGWIQRTLQHLSQHQADNGMLQKLSQKHSNKEDNGLFLKTPSDRRPSLQLESFLSMPSVQIMLKELMLYLLSMLLQLRDGLLLLSPMFNNSMQASLSWVKTNWFISIINSLELQSFPISQTLIMFYLCPDKHQESLMLIKMAQLSTVSTNLDRSKVKQALEVATQLLTFTNQRLRNQEKEIIRLRRLLPKSGPIKQLIGSADQELLIMRSRWNRLPKTTLLEESQFHPRKMRGDRTKLLLRNDLLITKS